MGRTKSGMLAGERPASGHLRGEERPDMATDTTAPDILSGAKRTLTLTAAGLCVAGLSAAINFLAAAEQPGWPAAIAVTFAVAGLITSGLGVSRRPKDAGVLALGAGTA